MDKKLACDWVVTKTKLINMKEGNELHGTEHFSVVNYIGYQIINADKLDDHAM